MTYIMLALLAQVFPPTSGELLSVWALEPFHNQSQPRVWEFIAQNMAC